MVSRTVGDVFEHWLDSNECPIYSHSGLWCAVVYKRGVSCRFYWFQCDHVDPAHVRLSSVAVPGRGYLLRDSASRVGFFSPINECLTATFFSPSAAAVAGHEARFADQCSIDVAGSDGCCECRHFGYRESSRLMGCDIILDNKIKSDFFAPAALS